jgi:histidine triad (HIT) family protein
MTMPAYDEQNIFAKILRGEIPSHKVYEDEHAIAIMDVMPQSEGHTLVIPKAPSRNIVDISAHDLQNLAIVVQRVARAVKKAFEAPGLTIVNYCEPAGGQTVFHTHVHVIPRYEGVPLRPHSGKMADQEHLAEQAFKIRAALGGAA